MDDRQRLKLLSRTSTSLRSNVCYFNSELLPDKYFAAFCVPGGTVVVQQVPNGPGEFNTKLLIDLPEKSSRDEAVLVCWGGGQQQLLAVACNKCVYLLSLQSLIPVNHQSSNAYPAREMRATHSIPAPLVAMQFTHAADGLLLADVLGKVSMLHVDQKRHNHEVHVNSLWQVNSDVQHDLIAAGANSQCPCATASQENNQKVLIWWPTIQSGDNSVGTEVIRHPVRVVSLEWSPSLSALPAALTDDQERSRNPALLTAGSDGVIRIWVEVVMKLPDAEQNPSLPTLSQYCTALVITPPTFLQSVPASLHVSWARQVKGSRSSTMSIPREPGSPSTSSSSRVLWLVCMLDFTNSGTQEASGQHVFVWALEGLAGIVLNGLPQGVITSSKPIPPRAVLWGSDCSTIRWQDNTSFQTVQPLRQGLTAFCDSTNFDSTPVLHTLTYCHNPEQQYAEMLTFSLATFTKTALGLHGSQLEPCIQLLEPAHQVLRPPSPSIQTLSIHPSSTLAASTDQAGRLLLWALMPVMHMVVSGVDDSAAAVAGMQSLLSDPSSLLQSLLPAMPSPSKTATVTPDSSATHINEVTHLTQLEPCVLCTWLHDHDLDTANPAEVPNKTPQVLAVAHADSVSILALQLDVGKQVMKLKQAVRLLTIPLPTTGFMPQYLAQVPASVGMARGSLSLLLLSTESPNVEAQHESWVHFTLHLHDRYKPHAQESDMPSEEPTMASPSYDLYCMDTCVPLHEHDPNAIVTCLHVSDAPATRWIMTGTSAGRVHFWYAPDPACLDQPQQQTPAGQHAGSLEKKAVTFKLMQECLCTPACALPPKQQAGSKQQAAGDGAAATWGGAALQRSAVEGSGQAQQLEENSSGGGALVHVCASHDWHYAAAITVCGRGELEDGLYIWRHCPWVVQPKESSSSSSGEAGAGAGASWKEWEAARFLLEAAVSLGDTGSCCTWLKHAAVEPLLAVGYAAGILHVFGRQHKHHWQVLAEYHSVLPITCLSGLSHGLMAASAGDQLLVLHNVMSLASGPPCLLPDVAHKEGGALPLYHPSSLQQLLRKGLLDSVLHILRRLVQLAQEVAALPDSRTHLGGILDLKQLQSDLLSIILECSWPDARVGTLQELRQAVYDWEDKLQSAAVNHVAASRAPRDHAVEAGGLATPEAALATPVNGNDVSTGLLNVPVGRIGATAQPLSQAPTSATPATSTIFSGLLDMSAFGMPGFDVSDAAPLPTTSTPPAAADPGQPSTASTISSGLLDMSAFGMSMPEPEPAPNPASASAKPLTTSSISTGLLDMSAFGMSIPEPEPEPAPNPASASTHPATTSSISTGLLDMSAFGMSMPEPEPAPNPASTSAQPSTTSSISTGLLDMSAFGMSLPEPEPAPRPASTPAQPAATSSISTGLLDMSAFGMSMPEPEPAPNPASASAHPAANSSISTGLLDMSAFGMSMPQQASPAAKPPTNKSLVGSSISSGLPDMSSFGLSPIPLTSSVHTSTSSPPSHTAQPSSHIPPSSSSVPHSATLHQASTAPFPATSPGPPAGHIPFPRAFAVDLATPSAALLSMDELSHLEQLLRGTSTRPSSSDGGAGAADEGSSHNKRISQALSLSSEATQDLLHLAHAVSDQAPGALSSSGSTWVHGGGEQEKQYKEHLSSLDHMGRLALVSIRLAATTPKDDERSHPSRTSTIAESVLKLFRSMPAVSKTSDKSIKRLQSGSESVEKDREVMGAAEGTLEGANAGLNIPRAESQMLGLRRPRSTKLKGSQHSSAASLSSLLHAGEGDGSVLQTPDPSAPKWTEWIRLLPGLETISLFWAHASSTPGPLLDALTSLPTPSESKPEPSTQSSSFSFFSSSSSSSTLPRMAWQNLRRLGVAFWLTDIAVLKKAAEAVARVQFNSKRDPHDCALMYLALQRKAVLVGLFKSGGNRKVIDFFSRDFNLPANKHSAAKNAFALLGQHRYELAAAFFILADQWRDAVGVLLREAGDPQLALFVARLLDNSPSGPLQQWLLTKEMLPVALASEDPWAVGLVAMLAGDQAAAVLSMLPPAGQATEGVLRPADPSVLDFIVRLGIQHLSGRHVPRHVLCQLQQLVVSSTHQLEVWGLPLLALQTISLLQSCLYPSEFTNTAQPWLERLLAASLQDMVLYSAQSYQHLRPDVDRSLQDLKLRLIVQAPSESVHLLLHRLVASRQPIQLAPSLSLPRLKAGNPLLSPTSPASSTAGSAFSPSRLPRLRLTRSWHEEHDMMSPPLTGPSTPHSTAHTHDHSAPDCTPDGSTVSGSEVHEGVLAQPWNLAFFDGDRCRAVVCCHGDEFSMCREPFRPLAVATGKAGICQGELVAPEGHLQSEAEGPKSVLMGLMQQMLDHVRWTPDPWAMMTGDLARRGGPGAALGSHVFSDVLAQHPQRNLFLSGSSTGHLYLWQYGEDESRAVYSPHRSDTSHGHGMPSHWSTPRAMTFARTGHRFVAVGEGGLAALWQLDRFSSVDGVGYAEWSHQCVARHASGVAFLGDTGSQVLVAGMGERGGVVSLWDTMAHSGNACISMLTLRRSRAPAAISLACFGASPTLLCAADSGEISSYDLRMLAEERPLWTSSKLHSGVILSMDCWNTAVRTSGRAKLHPDLPQQIVVTGGKDGAISVLDLVDGRVVQVAEKAHYFPRKRLQTLFDRMPRPSPRSPRRPGPHPATLSKPPHSAVPAPVMSVVPCSQGLLSCGADGVVRFHCFNAAPPPGTA